MNKEVLKARTMKFAIDIIEFSEKIPVSRSNNHMAGQLIRSATSVGANYRAALRGKSSADFLYKIKIIEEESDECIYWLELIRDTNNPLLDSLSLLHQEANELTAIFSAISKTLKKSAK